VLDNVEGVNTDDSSFKINPDDVAVRFIHIDHNIFDTCTFRSRYRLKIMMKMAFSAAGKNIYELMIIKIVENTTEL
jgi:hypothetical protein